jgi:arsenical-resistance protein 2
MAEVQPQKTTQWWEAFPAARAKCPELSSDDLMKKFDDMDLTPEPKSFLLVDVRRTDWEVRIFPLT